MVNLKFCALALTLGAPSALLGRNHIPAQEWLGRAPVIKLLGSGIMPVFSEDFESVPDNSVSNISEILPALGWTIAGEHPLSPFEAYYLQDLPAHSGKYYLYSPFDENEPRDEWAFSPAFHLDAGTPYHFTVHVNAPGYRAMRDEFRVTAGKTPSAEEMSHSIFEAIGDNAILTDENEWRRISCRFDVRESGDYHIGINHCSGPDGNYVSFDDIAIRPVMPEGGEIEFARAPYFEYTSIPTGWDFTTPLVVDYCVRNIGDSPLSDASLNLTAQRQDTEAGSASANIDILEWDETQEGQARIGIEGIGTSNGNSLSCRGELRTPAGTSLASIVAEGIPMPDFSTQWLARDNGQIAGCISLSIFEQYKTAGRIGTRFNLPCSAIVDAVKFTLLDGYSTATEVIARLYKINKKGAIIEYAASRREQLQNNSDGYTEYTLTFPSSIEITPGDYLLTLDESNGEALGLALTSNYTGRSLVFSIDGTEWSTLEGTPALRLRSAASSGIESGTIAADITITSVDGGFKVYGADPSDRLTVYSISGAIIMDMDMPKDGEVAPHSLAPGIYIVRVGGKSFKIVVA